MKVLFLDESGDHNLRRVNPVYPVFVRGGIIVDRAYTRDVIDPRMRRFKQRFFGREDVILHTVDMGKGRGDYAFLADPLIRTNFFASLNSMLRELEYLVIACVIKKPEFVAKYGNNAQDPYMYCLEILVERFCQELGDTLDGGFICAEKRNPGLDRELLDAWQKLIAPGGGIVSMPPSEIDARIVRLDLKDKMPNLAGSQLADLVITPIGRHVAGMPPKENEVQWSVVETKLRRVSGDSIGRDLVIRP